MDKAEEQVGLLIKKYKVVNKLYNEMFQTYEKQIEALENDKLIEANEIINKRGILISEIDEYNKEIDEIKRALKISFNIDDFNFSNTKRKISSENFKALEEATSETKNLLKKMIEIDEIVMQMYKKKLDVVKGKIKHLESGKKVLNAYKVIDSHARFIDKRK
ncbi:MAG: hypothetical protein PWQ82_1018 [Thermosediminibacterales bacterium]|nr:hypothetical protein [Thermosediminibacterales bacterium]MDK2836204.1 hypothetical protein [Thermosediminibacterales bacterium]